MEMVEAELTVTYQRLKPILSILKPSLLYFQCNTKLKTIKDHIVQAIRVSTAILIIILAWVIHFVRSFEFDWPSCFGKDTQGAANISMDLWAAQATIAFLCLLYWQVSGQLSKFFCLMEKCDCTILRENLHMRKMLFRQIVYGCIILILVLREGITNLYEFVSKSGPGSTTSIIYELPIPVSILLGGICISWEQLPWFLALTIFLFCTNCYYYILLRFNKKMSRDIRKFNNITLAQHYFAEHARLCHVVDQLNVVFSKYILAQVVLTVSALIFQSYIMVSSFAKLSLENKFQHAAYLLIYSFQLISLTLTPAYLHEQLQKPKLMLYQDIQLWVKCDMKMYNILYAFCNKISCSSLGISLCGFITITKPLLLSAVSLIATYLFLLIQFRSAESEFPECGKFLLKAHNITSFCDLL